MKNSTLTLALIFGLAGIGLGWYAIQSSGLYSGKHSSQTVFFNADVRPILNKNCLACHGGVRQSGGFSLLFEDEAFRINESGEPAIIPGQPDSSRLIKLIKLDDPEDRMPLDHPPLSTADIQTLESWIGEGANWEVHWAYVPFDAPTLPNPHSASWTQNGIDYFILDRMQQAGLKPAPRASCSTLIRRASLDLTGLPPTPAQADAFCSDSSPDAFEKVVDNLLNSPAFGEKWASMWLDLARYADSKGYEKDGPRNIWKYRDWVIDAFNQDMPFDEFTIKQLAGDLLPQPTESDLIATAFHRNTMNNDEGGTDDEEFRMAAVFDRVNTTWEAWMGTTMSCVQCHSHPYDPFTHKEYFEFLAFFNNTADKDSPDEYPTLATYADSNRVEVDSLISWFAENSPSPINSTHFQGQQVDSIFAHTDREGVILSPSSQTKHARLKAITAEARTPIVQELAGTNRRKTHLLNRGNFRDPLEEVFPDVPGVMPAFPDSLPKNRLGLAKWIVSDTNPLTSRTIVNRFWAQLFGTGFVETLEDFGTQGLAPSHPELLNWLAHQFSNEHQWRVKPLLKQIVMSATYQQMFDGDANKLYIDPDNRLLAQGPRIRLSAEQIRDQALAVSGLLSAKQKGPSVYPYQPAGIWNAPYSSAKWETSEEGDQHRRGLYTYWRRSAPYPSMITFDSKSREICISRRINTNTPLQALVTLNDPVFVEAAEALAARIFSKNLEGLDAQLIGVFKQALLKDPSPAELEVLRMLYREAYFDYTEDHVDLLEDGVLPEQAALTVVANAVLNLDAFIMRG